MTFVFHINYAEYRNSMTLLFSLDQNVCHSGLKRAKITTVVEIIKIGAIFRNLLLKIQPISLVYSLFKI